MRTLEDERDRAVITCDAICTAVIKLQIANDLEMQFIHERLKGVGLSDDELRIVEKFMHDIRCINDNGVFVTPCNKDEALVVNLAQELQRNTTRRKS